MQAHDPTLFCFRQTALLPHGEGTHGSTFSTGYVATNGKILITQLFYKVSSGYEIRLICLLGLITHCEKGSPVYPFGQMHMGVWLTTRHSAFRPQEPAHGSLHFWLMHAKLFAHSLLLMHSGRQFGGYPMKSGKQEHDGESLITWHWELGPQEDGWQGLVGVSSVTAWTNKYSKLSELLRNMVKRKVNVKLDFLLIWHKVNGFPVNCWGQLHMGLWLITWHWALTPQAPTQGSIHFWLEQARSRVHSELWVHSGLQEGGLPRYPLIHAHTACWLISRQTLFGPQGDGLQGFRIGSSA